MQSQSNIGKKCLLEINSDFGVVQVESIPFFFDSGHVFQIVSKFLSPDFSFRIVVELS